MTTASDGAALFIEPQSHHFMGDRLFESDAVPFAGDRLMAPYTYLREVLTSRGVAVHTADAMADWPRDANVLYVAISNLSRYASLARRADVTLSAFFAMECPAVEPAMYRGLPAAGRAFRRMYSWSDSASLQPYVGAPLDLHRCYWPQSFNHVHEDLWAAAGRKFLVMMHGNKRPALLRDTLHLERLRAVEYFARTGEIDLYGREWDQPPYRVGITHIPYTIRVAERRVRAMWQRIHRDPLLEAARRAWRGPAASKSQTLSRYRFAICFENMTLKGWITEKLFDCFYTGTVPVYLGAPDILDHVPAECFVDMRRFAGYAELGDYLRSLSDAKVAAYREAARAYLESPLFQRFSKEAFADIFVRIVEEDAGVRTVAPARVAAGAGAPARQGERG